MVETDTMNLVDPTALSARAVLNDHGYEGFVVAAGSEFGGKECVIDLVARYGELRPSGALRKITLDERIPLADVSTIIL